MASPRQPHCLKAVLPGVQRFTRGPSLKQEVNFSLQRVGVRTVWEAEKNHLKQPSGNPCRVLFEEDLDQSLH